MGNICSSNNAVSTNEGQTAALKTISNDINSTQKVWEKVNQVPQLLLKFSNKNGF